METQFTIGASVVEEVKTPKKDENGDKVKIDGRMAKRRAAVLETVYERMTGLNDVYAVEKGLMLFNKTMCHRTVLKIAFKNCKDVLLKLEDEKNTKLDINCGDDVSEYLIEYFYTGYMTKMYEGKFFCQRITDDKFYAILHGFCKFAGITDAVSYVEDARKWWVKKGSHPNVISRTITYFSSMPLVHRMVKERTHEIIATFGYMSRALMHPVIGSGTDPDKYAASLGNNADIFLKNLFGLADSDTFPLDKFDKMAFLAWKNKWEVNHLPRLLGKDIAFLERLVNRKGI